MADLRVDFIVIGAMKCGTSTLAAQLGAQTGIFLTDPKEPNFFSDDAHHARGLAWYEALFDDALPNDLTGEASTHYTKLPVLPETLGRMSDVLGETRFVYMIRNPLTRTVSHYLHEWSNGVIREDLNEAIDKHPELISYSCYGYQIAPYVEAFGPERVMVATLEDMNRAPERTLAQICDFIGHSGPAVWQSDMKSYNVSAERFRKFPMHKLVFANPVAAAMRRALVPKFIRRRIKETRKIPERPQFSPENTARLKAIFARDRVKLREVFPHRDDLDICYPFLKDG